MRYLVLLIGLLGTAAVADIRGPIRVIDGDTIDVADTRIRLFGIDAPEMGQPCVASDGVTFNCGAWVKTQVTQVFENHQAVCAPVETDRYGRTVATCLVDGKDVGATLVTAGLATAFTRYSDAYVAAEKGAVLAGRGLWAFEMDLPSTYRRAAASVDELPSDCQIKGNITANGRIYHMPHNRDYGRTRINEASGERWFCTEADARRAGWRPARN